MAKEIGGGSGYLIRNSGLYGHEDGRHRNGDRPRCREVPRSLYMKTVVGPMKTVFVGKTVHLAAGSSFRKIKSRIAKRFTKEAYLC